MSDTFDGDYETAEEREAAAEALGQDDAWKPWRLLKRIEAIEARQRDHQMHDPDCPIRRYQKHDAQGRTGAIWEKPCDCWLAE